MLRGSCIPNLVKIGPELSSVNYGQHCELAHNVLAHNVDRNCRLDGHRTDGRTDAKVVLYSVQCCTLHWTDNNNNPRDLYYRGYKKIKKIIIIMGSSNLHWSASHNIGNRRSTMWVHFCYILERLTNLFRLGKRCWRDFAAIPCILRCVRIGSIPFHSPKLAQNLRKSVPNF